jgi:hypothetical protein
MKNASIAVLLVLFILTASTSCMFRMLQAPPAPTVLEEDQLPTTIAILPFANKTANPEAGSLVRKMFYNFFSSLNYRDLEPYVIDDNLKINHLYAGIAAGENISPQKLGQLLGVDAVIYGDVLSLGKMYALVYSNSQAGLNARMVRCDSGQVLWELEHTIHLEEGDVPISPIGLAMAVFRTAYGHQQATHMRAAAELCMQMVATIPNPSAVREPPPKIQALVHNGAGKLIQPGEYLKVAMIGEKNQIASWSIPPLIENLPMKEKRPGVYIGAYRIEARDRLPNGRLVGYLRAKSGVGNQWMDTLGPVKIGKPTLLPDVISRDHKLSIESSPYLVNDALVVKPGVKLTINAGTVIWFNSNSLGMIVNGELQILGTRDNPVRLSSLDRTSWKGIILDRSFSENKIRFCTLSNAEIGIRASQSNISIQNSRFQDNVWGVVTEACEVEILSSLIRTSIKTGVAAHKTQLLIKNSVITENGSGGILLENSQARIEQNNIMNNGAWEIKVLDGNGRVQANKNWWGHANPIEKQIIGPVAIQPTLKAAIGFNVWEGWEIKNED